MASMDPKATAFSAALSAAIAESGITLSALSRRLKDNANPVSLATLSYWRSGDRAPEGAASRTAVENIEQILGVRRGELMSLLTPSSRLGTLSPAKVLFDEEREQREAAETLAALNSVSQDELRDLSTQVTAYVGRNGAVERTVMRSLVQSTRGTIAELPLIDIAPEESDAMSVISDVSGGRVDREYAHPGRLLSGVVIVLDEPIAVGATALFEFTESFPPGYPPRQSVWHATSRPSRETLIWVHFHPDALPRWCEEYVEADGDYSSTMKATKSGAVHVARHGFGPGVLGIRWGYDS